MLFNWNTLQPCVSCVKRIFPFRKMAPRTRVKRQNENDTSPNPSTVQQPSTDKNEGSV